MPKVFSGDKVPDFVTVRISATKEFGEILDYVNDFLKEPKNIDPKNNEAIAFDSSDGVTEDNFGRVSSAIRNQAKIYKLSVRCLWKDEILWVRVNGPLEEKTPEEILAARERRESNKAIREEMAKREAAANSKPNGRGKK
jgi:hypothetical protein